MGLTADSVPLAAASISWPVLTLTVLPPPDTPTVPAKTLMRLELLARTRRSNWVPLTAAEAWTTKNHQPPPAARSRARTKTSRQPPHPNPQPRPKQPDFLAVGGGVTC